MGFRLGGHRSGPSNPGANPTGNAHRRSRGRFGSLGAGVAAAIAVTGLTACAGAPPAPTCPPTRQPVEAPFANAKTILLIGDSTMTTVAPTLDQELRRNGFTGQLIDKAWPGTELGGSAPPPDPPYDWLGPGNALPGYLNTFHPDIVIADFIGMWGDPNSTITRSFQAINMIKGAGAKAVWVIPPAMEDGAFANTPYSTAYLNAIANAYTALPADAFVDWRSVLTPTGVWVPCVTLPMFGAVAARVDTVHFTPVGELLVAQETEAVLARLP